MSETVANLPQAQGSLEALSEIAQVINSIHKPDDLLEEVLRIAMGTLQADRGFLLLTSEAHPAGYEVKVSANFNTRPLSDPSQISSSVVHDVLRREEPVLLYEALKDERYATMESIVLHQIQSIACVPLRLKSRLIGAIYLDSLTRRGRFTQENLPFLTAFAHQAAVAIENAQFYTALRTENRLLREEVNRVHGFSEIVGQSPRMREVLDMVTRVLDTDATVLIEGESGTGKELIARAIHYNGLRKTKPFVAVFCGSLPDNLLESELFGHKKGAFTGAVADKRGLFEVASGGTIFLDEVGDLSPRMQTTLLRVLQEGEIKRVGETQTRQVDVRVLSATNRTLTKLVEEGEFREDLYYRLNIIALQVPPLRRRHSDIPLLAHHFLDKYASGRRSHIKGFTPDAIKALQGYPWPGNVRELENTVERAVVLTRNELITKEDLRLPEPSRLDPFEPEVTLKEAERRVVLRSLEEHDGNVSETARALGVSRRWLHYRLKEWESIDE